MRPGTELALGAAVLLVLGAGAAALGSRRARVGDGDPRRSTYLVGPSGASAFAEALNRLGVRVDRLRRPVSSIDTATAGTGRLVAFLGPSAPLTLAEGKSLAALPSDLLLAGPSAALAMRCLGYDVVPWNDGAVAVRRPVKSDSLAVPWVGSLLQRRTTPVVVDSSDTDGTAVSCTVLAPREVDTLLRAVGRPVVVGLLMNGGRRVLLVSDDRLFSNRALRETAAGPFVLGLITPRYREVLLDEYHHGFDASRSLAGATFSWSLQSPWGWAIWQLVTVGILALLAAGVRFGPAQRVIQRRRRSPLEHVRALATALAAARGHDVAVRLIVQGLRRRLSRAGRGGRDAPTVWLEAIAPAVRTSRGRNALERLTTIASRPAAADEVREAADAVETLWEELKPS